MLTREQGFSLLGQNTWLIAESGASRDRIGFRQALRAVGQGDISRIFVFSVDRLGRNLLEMLIFLRDLEEMGIECWDAEKRRKLFWNDFMLQIEGAVAGKERQEIIKRTQDGLIRAVKAGKYSGGIIAYGYRLNPQTKQLEIEEEEAGVVRRIFQWCVEERLTCTQIAERLNALGIPTRYRKDNRKLRPPGKRQAEHTAGIWRAGRVRHMLRNPAYKGTWLWGKRSAKGARPLIAGYCPEIVSEDIFRQADGVLRSNRWEMTHPGKKRQFLLRGLIKCADCGLTYSSAAFKTSGKYRRYYRCTGAHAFRKLGRPKCFSKSIRAAEIEEVVWHDIKSFVKSPRAAIEHLKLNRQPVDDALGSQLAEVESQLAQLAAKERTLLRISAESSQVDIKALDDVLAEVRSAASTLTAHRNFLSRRIASEEEDEQALFRIAARLSDLRSRIEKADFEQRRRSVEELVKSIEVVTRDLVGKRTAIVTITYRFEDPEPPRSFTTYPVPSEMDYTPALADSSATR